MTGPNPPHHEPGPLEGALEALWSGYSSSWRRLISRGMVRELELRAYFDPFEMDPRRVANEVPEGTIPDCPSCTNICCAGLENVVSLRLRDVAVLIDIGRTDLMSKKKPNFPVWMLEERPGLKDLVGSTLFRTLPVMRQVGEPRRCVALTPDLRCSLYPHWPTSCERFPYALNARDRKVRWGTRCPEKQRAPELRTRSRALFLASVDAYNQKVRDAVLVTHAKQALDELGIGAWLTTGNEDPFEPVPDGEVVVR